MNRGARRDHTGQLNPALGFGETASSNINYLDVAHNVFDD
jgi:hypothetical protein